MILNVRRPRRWKTWIRFGRANGRRVVAERRVPAEVGGVGDVGQDYLEFEALLMLKPGKKF